MDMDKDERFSYWWRALLAFLLMLLMNFIRLAHAKKKEIVPVFPSHQVECDRIEIEEYKQRLQELTE